MPSALASRRVNASWSSFRQKCLGKTGAGLLMEVMPATDMAARVAGTMTNILRRLSDDLDFGRRWVSGSARRRASCFQLHTSARHVGFWSHGQEQENSSGFVQNCACTVLTLFRCLDRRYLSAAIGEQYWSVFTTLTRPPGGLTYRSQADCRARKSFTSAWFVAVLQSTHYISLVFRIEYRVQANCSIFVPCATC